MAGVSVHWTGLRDWITGLTFLSLKSCKAVFLGSVQHYRELRLITGHKIFFSARVSYRILSSGGNRIVGG